MIVFPNAKINLGLSVISKRSDGFHELQTVFFPVPVRDVLEIVSGHPTESKNKENNFPGIHFSTTGIPIDGESQNNLCIRAYNLLSADFPEIPAVQLHLHKHIPMGAGLGGGSSDAAFTLKLLNDLFLLSLSHQQLIDYAAQLGSDCPFFIINKPCYATSRGEVMEEIELDLSLYQMVFINPGIHINTGWAFSQLDLSRDRDPEMSLKEIIRRPVSAWKDLLTNDFEEPVFAAHSEIGEIKQTLYRSGAIYASMSGSGSTMFGIFEKGSYVQPQFPGHYSVIHA